MKHACIKQSNHTLSVILNSPHCQESTNWIGGQTSYCGNQHVDVDIATNKRGTKGYTPTNKRCREPVY